MDDVSRKNLDDEIHRVQNKLKTLDPGTEQYMSVRAVLISLAEIANKDDDARNKFEIEQDKLDVEKDRLDHEASLEASKRGLESERMEYEQRLKDAELQQREADAKRSWWQFGIGCAVTAFTWIGSWVMNARAQARSEYFESTGHAYTSRFSRFQTKDPVHPAFPPVKK